MFLSGSMAVTLDSLDDSLIERKQKEISELKAQNNELNNHLLAINESLKEWDNRYNTLLEKYNEVVQKNNQLAGKLLYYEHEPFKIDSYTDNNGDFCVEVLYWNKEKNLYDLFAKFYENLLEQDIEEFCQEFIIELKDAYMVE